MNADRKVQLKAMPRLPRDSAHLQNELDWINTMIKSRQRNIQDNSLTMDHWSRSEFTDDEAAEWGRITPWNKAGLLMVDQVVMRSLLDLKRKLEALSDDWSFENIEKTYNPEN